MKSLSQVLQLSCDYLQSKGSKFARREVEELIASTLGLKRLDLYLNFDKPLVEHELVKVRKNLARLAANEPLQYIEGSVYFYNSTIKVDQRVLIPRPETELLVDIILKRLAIHNLSAMSLWDICTGSGCLAIAIKKQLNDLCVIASDLSVDALQLAQENAAVNQVDIRFYQGDLLAPFVGQKTNFIVCNPPYLSEHDYTTLDPHVKEFEPKLALVSGKSGFECYERLIQQLKKYVLPNGVVWFEIGINQAEQVCSLLHDYMNVRRIKDFAGIERFIEFQIPS